MTTLSDFCGGGHWWFGLCAHEIVRARLAVSKRGKKGSKTVTVQLAISRASSYLESSQLQLDKPKWNKMIIQRTAVGHSDRLAALQHLVCVPKTERTVYCFGQNQKTPFGYPWGTCKTLRLTPHGGGYNPWQSIWLPSQAWQWNIIPFWHFFTCQSQQPTTLSLVIYVICKCCIGPKS